MTTVLWRPGILAADRRVSGDMTYTACKITIHENKYALAIVGDLSNASMIRRWFELGCDPDTFPDISDKNEYSAELIVADCNGNVYTYSRCHVPEFFEMPFIAWGSGGMAAMGALRMGATVQEAISTAAACDYSTGEGIDIVNLSGPVPIMTRLPILPVKETGLMR